MVFNKFERKNLLNDTLPKDKEVYSGYERTVTHVAPFMTEVTVTIKLGYFDDSNEFIADESYTKIDTHCLYNRSEAITQAYKNGDMDTLHKLYRDTDTPHRLKHKIFMMVCGLYETPIKRHDNKGVVFSSLQTVL